MLQMTTRLVPAFRMPHRERATSARLWNRRFPRVPAMVALAFASFLSPSLHAQRLKVDLRDALARAKNFSQQVLASTNAAALAQEDRVQARASLLPQVANIGQYVLTEARDGRPSGVFIANNGVHEFREQALVHSDVYAPGRLSFYRRMQAAEAAASARKNIATRGMAVTVIQNYYAVIQAERKLENVQLSLGEAQRFFDITQKQERGGEVAHTDVVRAQLQLQQRQREQLDAQTAIEKAKLNLAVMLFPDLNQAFTVVDDLKPDAASPAEDDVARMAFVANPELSAAEAVLNQASLDVRVARGAFLPTVSVDYFFGLNANNFGYRGADGARNLGSAVQGTVAVPIWNWGITRSKVKQAELIRQQAQTDLSLTRRQVQADVSGFTLEAKAARTQLQSLQASMALATESVRLTLLRYQAGESTALEVVDAQSSLADARNAYDDGLVRYKLVLANLDVLMGRL
jgi:outer membrane protein TolC